MSASPDSVEAMANDSAVPTDAADKNPRARPPHAETTVNDDTVRVDPSNHRLRRVGRLARRRLRLDVADLANGVYTDGHLSVEISGLVADGVNGPATFDWRSDRPVALVIIRSSTEGADVSFVIGPLESGTVARPDAGDGGPIGYVAFAYDTEPETESSTARAGSMHVGSLLVRLLTSPSPA